MIMETMKNTDAVAADIKTEKIGYRFLCCDDRELLRKEGLSVQADGNVKYNGDGTYTLPDGTTAFGFSYAKAPEKIQWPKEERDNEGFFVPKPDPYRHDGRGVFCEIFGDSPEHVIMDMDGGLDRLSKEAYEYEIRSMLCRIRRAEERMHKRFAHMDDYDAGASASKTEEERSKTASEVKKFKDFHLNFITWKYDWIQYYKKDCYLFAQYVIEDKWKKVNPEKVLEGLSEDEKRQALSLGEGFDLIDENFKKYHSKKGKGKKGKAKKNAALTAADECESNISENVRRAADRYWRLVRREKKKADFCQRFVQEVATMPEANRKLIDTMYEMAWSLIWEYCHDLYPEQVPAPWYDTISIVSADISQGGAAADKDEGSTEGNS